MTTPLFVGIDVSKNSLDVHVLPSGHAFSVSNQQEGFEKLLEVLRANAPKCIVLEATGGYETKPCKGEVGQGAMDRLGQMMPTERVSTSPLQGLASLSSMPQGGAPMPPASALCPCMLE